MQASDVLDTVRRRLRQVPLTGESVGTDAQAQEAFDHRFSDEDLLGRLYDAEGAVVSRVKAAAVPLAITRYDSGLPDLPADLVRLLFRRVHYPDGSAVSYDAPYDPQGFFEGTPSAGATLYAFVASRAAELTAVAVTTGTNPSGAGSLSITKNGSAVGSVALAASGTHTPTFSTTTVVAGDVIRVVVSGSTDGADFTISFTGTAEIVETDPDVGTRAVQRSADRHRRLEAAGRAATSAYPAFVYEDGQLNVYPDNASAVAFYVARPPRISLSDYQANDDAVVCDERFMEALVAHVCASCHQTLGNGEMAGAYAALFEDEIAAHALGVRHNALYDDAEVFVE